MIRVAVVDDHLHVAIALRALLAQTPDIRLVAESRRGGDVAALVRRTRPDVLLLDLLIEPEFDALAIVRHLRGDFPDLKVCLLSAYLEPSLVRDLLQAGVYGYISSGRGRNHLSAVYRKLGVHSRHEALREVNDATRRGTADSSLRP